MTSDNSRGALGPFMSLSLVIGTMIGSGIYFLPSSLAPLGWNTAIAWGICGAGALCLAASFRFLMDGTGEGIQHNVERVIGEVPSFLGVFAYWATCFTSVAALAIAGGSILMQLVAEGADEAYGVMAAVGLVAVLTAINLAGTRSAGRFQVASVVIKLLPLLVVIGVVAWLWGSGGDLNPVAPAEIGFDNISSAVALALFALLGFEAATIPVNKIRNPERNIPIALLGGTGFVTVLYLLVTTGLMLILPWEAIAASGSPVSEALTTVLGPVAGTFLALCIMVSVVGCANGIILIGADCSYSMALRREMPGFLASTNARGVPWWGIVVQGGGAIALILLNSSRGLSGIFTFLALLTTGGVLVFYVTALAAAMKENRKAGRWPILMLGLAFAAFAIYGSGIETNLWVLVLLAIGLGVRWLCRRSVLPAATA